MRYKSTYEILQPIVSSIDKTFKIESIVDNEDGTFDIFSCNTLWATVGFIVTINANDYTITEANPNVSITIKPVVEDDIPTGDSFILYPPVFYHGTIKATEYEVNKEINRDLSAIDRLPMIWLHEPTDERWSESSLESIALRSQCELYFMTDADFSAWDNADHYNLAIKPMRNLMSSFMDAVRASYAVDDDQLRSSNVKDFARWGVYLGKDGQEHTIFSRQMSGTRMDIEISFIRTNDLCC